MTPSGRLGGAERSLLDLLAGLRASQPQWKLHLVIGGDGPLARLAEAHGVTTTTLPFPQSFARLGDAAAGGPAGRHLSRAHVVRRMLTSTLPVLAYVRRLRHVLAELTPDILHTNGIKAHVLGAWARPPGARLIWHVHDYVGRRPIAAWILRLHAGRCTAILANSRSVAADVHNACTRRTPIHCLYNGVDLDRFAPKGSVADLDMLAGLPPAPPGTVRVGLVATFGRWKGHVTFLRALACLPIAPTVRGYVVGGPLYTTEGSQYTFDELRHVAAELGLGDRVGFTGFVDDVAPVMRAVDIVVHASTEPEPFGLVIAEAMACGRAIIVSAAGGASELIEPDVDALAHRPGDAGTLATHLTRLAGDADLRARLGKAARATAERRFDRARLAAEVVPIYTAARRGQMRARRWPRHGHLPTSNQTGMRVLHLFLVSDIGGGEGVLLNLIRFRERSDIEHDAVVLANEDGPLGEELTRVGVRWRLVRRGRMRNPFELWRAARQLSKIVEEFKSDAILANSSQGYLYAWWSTRGLRVPIALYYMNVPRRRLWTNHPLDVLTFCGRPPTTLAASHAIASILTAWGVHDVATVYHGTPAEPASVAEVDDVRRVLDGFGVAGEDPLILFPGRLESWKGQHVLLEAMPIVLASHPNAHAVLLGGSLFGRDPRYQGRLQRLIARLALEERVHIAGHRPVRGWLERASVVVHASTRPDPFPNVCLEALAARRPLVTNTLSGTCEILVDGRDARMVPPNDPAALARALIAVLDDPAEAARMSAAGHERYRTTCTPPDMVRRVEATLAGMVRGE